MEDFKMEVEEERGKGKAYRLKIVNNEK